MYSNSWAKLTQLFSAWCRRFLVQPSCAVNVCVCPRVELHLFGPLGHIRCSALVRLATAGLGTSSNTHNASAAQDWQKGLGKWKQFGL